MAEVQDWMALAKPDPEWNKVRLSSKRLTISFLRYALLLTNERYQAVDEMMGGQQPDLGVFPGIPELRTWITNAKQATAALMGAGKIEGVVEKDHEVEMRDGHKITCRVYRPEQKPAGGSPLFVVYHGGGWCIGKILYPIVPDGECD